MVSLFPMISEKCGDLYMFEPTFRVWKTWKFLTK